MLKFPGARCILLVYSSILAVITKESFVKIILYLCAMSTVWTGSCFQGTWNTIGRRWCRHRYNRRSEYSGPMEGNTGRTTSFFQRRDVIFIEVDFWLGFLSVCLFLFFFGCVVWLVGSQFPDQGHGSESPNPNHFRPPGKPSGLGFWMLDRNWLDLKVKESPCSRVTHLSKRINLCGVFEDW